MIGSSVASIWRSQVNDRLMAKISRRSLPIPLPLAADTAQHRVFDTAVIFQPCRLVRIMVQVLRADVVMLAANHAAHAREVAFDHVGVLAVVRVSQLGAFPT